MWVLFVLGWTLFWAGWAGTAPSLGLYTTDAVPETVAVLITDVSPDSGRPVALHGCLLPSRTLKELRERGVFVLKGRSAQYHFDPFVS